MLLGYFFALRWVDSDGGRLVAVTPRQPDPLRFPFMSTAVPMKRGDSWERALPVSGNLFACQDDPAERIDELAVGFGYGFPVPGESMAPEGLKPRLWMSNIGCYRWAGTVSGSKSADEHGPPEQTTAQVTFLRDNRDGMEVQFSVSEGSFTWKTWGTYSGCSYSGEDAWSGTGPYEGGLRFLPQIVNGPGHRGYEGAAYGHLVNYRITCPDGDGGTITTDAQKTVFWLNTVNAADPVVPQVSADGLTAVGTADDGNMVYTWSFTSTPGP